MSAAISSPPDTADQRVALLTVDPDLGADIPSEELPFARRLVVAETCALDTGPWEPVARDAFALLVLDGVICREVELAGRRSSELFGAGDVLRQAADLDSSLVPHDVRWTVLEPGSVAVLGKPFTAAARRWPSLGTALTKRLLAQSERIALHVAIAQLGRVDERLIALLWQLADRWGRVTSDGVLVPLALTHEALGRLVGAQRPTVTLALADLAQDGTVTRQSKDGWLLARDSRERLRHLGGRPAAAHVVAV